MSETATSIAPKISPEGLTLFLFGGHGAPQTKGSLGGHIRRLLEGPNAAWLKDILSGLPNYFEALVQQSPDIGNVVPGASQLADLYSWVSTGAGQQDEATRLSSPQLGALMVAIQLDQYWTYLELKKGTIEDDAQDLLVSMHDAHRNVQVVGFSMGLLAAVAVSSANNRKELEEHGAVAVRLGMIIGALVDATDEWDTRRSKGPSVSFVAAWRGPKQSKEMTRIVSAQSPAAYISTLYDEARATIATSERSAANLLRQLRSAGITVAETDIKGHMHTPDPERKRHTYSILELCDRLPGLKFPDASALCLPTYDNSGEKRPVPANRGNLTDMVMRAILMQQCKWYETFSKVLTSCDTPNLSVVEFGLSPCVPPTVQRRLGSRQVHFDDLNQSLTGNSASLARRCENGEAKQHQHAHSHETAAGGHMPNAAAESNIQTADPLGGVTKSQKNLENTIAVVGMSIKTAGADDLDDFAAMLKTGKSQHELVTRDRLMPDMLFRQSADADPARKYYGNFMRDADAFDHKFFKRSPREAQTMDPQSRLTLEAAYQAVEQSGYFSEPRSSTTLRDKKHVGVYVGCCGVDYHHNVDCHEPNAFTATGNLKPFIVGKVSHYFGWTGPALMIDTACSSGAVAIHTACRALLAGECTAALAGGVNNITTMYWMQNLAAGSFLSPTGQCKPFDDSADGYCRGEGLALVFLKKLSDAIADGNPILATLPATAVYQNQNCTPLFVPNAPSLSRLFKDVLHRADVAPQDVSLVEAHGTGTPVGDPAEYESVRLALGGPIRNKPLPIGSVKGHIGHTEGASGAIALVKTIMMMRDGFIPPQASFTKMNHHIQVRPDDMMEVVTSLRPWEEDYKVALINNYGACGSNASMVVAQAPVPRTPLSFSSSRFPFWITGLDLRSIAAYGSKLLSYLDSRAQHEEASLPDISFNLCRQSNRDLPRGLIFSCGSLAEFKAQLAQLAASASTSKKQNEAALALGVVPVKAERPVIMCFGGQVSTSVGLDRQLYDGVAVLRKHLDECDDVIKSLGLASIYPDLFSTEPVQDTVKLQTMLFATQYSFAKSWIDCGLEGKVAAVVGHSFGEITALCVSGALSLVDTVKLVAGRAKLVRDSWGPESGSMIAVEADECLVQDLLQQTNSESDGSVSIACYNGPRSFTLAGSTRAIDVVADILTNNTKFNSSGIKSKRLNVTNAFHSSLVDRLVNGLEKVGTKLTFREPEIPVERATEHASLAPLDEAFVPTHMRNPVFFKHAIHRLAQNHPRAIFLEAGFNSTITVMAARALAQASSPANDHHFQAVSLTSNKAAEGLVDSTVGLWKQGLRVTFFGHYALQAAEYAQLILPPYQFDKSESCRHWLGLKSPLEAVKKAAEELASANGHALGPQRDTSEGFEDPKTLPLWSFVGHVGNKKQQELRFRVNTTSDEYQRLFSGHVIAQTAPICPGTLQTDIAIETLFSLHPEWKEDGYTPTVLDVVYHGPLCSDSSLTVYIDFKPLDESGMRWGFKMFSVSAGGGDNHAALNAHVDGCLHIRQPTDEKFNQELARYERIVNHAHCKSLLSLNLDDDGVDIIQGTRNIYRAFSPVVDYSEIYRGMRCIVSRGDEAASILHKRHQGKTWLDTPLSDSVTQLGGFWANVIADIPETEMYVASGCELMMRSPKLNSTWSALKDGLEHGPGVWHVFARFTRQSEKTYMADIFSFNPESGNLAEVILGVQYTRVPKSFMSKMLARLTKDQSILRDGPPTLQLPPVLAQQHPEIKKQATKTTPKQKKESKGSGRRDITEDVRNLVANLAGVEASELDLDAEMADFGIDSLMGMELGREVENVFKCELDQNEQMEATSLRMFVQCVSNALAKASLDTGAREDDTESDREDSPYTSEEEESDGWSDKGTPSSSDSNHSTPNPNMGCWDTPNRKADLDSLGILVNNHAGLVLDRSDVLASFGEIKMLTDAMIRERGLDALEKGLIAGSNRLVAALVIEAMEELGCPLKAAAPGQALSRVLFLSQHARLMDWVYRFLERDARLIDVDMATGNVTRTRIPAPDKSSDAMLEELLNTQPAAAVTNRLAHYAGGQLASVLSGKTDGIRAIFGSPQGRELVQAMYCEHDFNQMSYTQMREVISRVVDRVKAQGLGPGHTLKVLEMGAGTGGTTNFIAPFLATVGIHVEYTFTDLSPSMVANARRKFGKQYPFMRFAVHDIEKPPTDELRGQHIVLASNAIHATHNLVSSTSNIRQALRPDGFLMFLEMTEIIPSMDIVFGLLEGWWLFDDGRNHAVVPAEHWERELHRAGYGHVDWTDGNLRENAFQKVMIALASGPQEPARLPKSAPEVKESALQQNTLMTRQLEAESLVRQHIQGWVTPKLQDATISAVESARGQPIIKTGAVVIVTGATGSLGAHLVQSLAENPAVETVVCVNRLSNASVEKRQGDAFLTRGITLSQTASSKLRILATDTSKPQLGLSAQDYSWLVQNTAHIIHNAWPMSGTRPIKSFEPQFQVMRNLLDLAREIGINNPQSRVGFQFISSIGVIGNYAGSQNVPESRVPFSAVMPGGYPEAKWVCERMLDETLHKFPSLFRAMSVRPGQIAGSTKSGYWNPVEHFAFIVKSAQTLRAWPDFDGRMQWIPVDECAAVMTDLLKIGDERAGESYPVYHVDNPVGQPWEEMGPVLAEALGIPSNGIVEFKEWLRRLRHSPLSHETEIPSARMVDWLERNFERMSCGGLVLGTEKANEHSETMRKVGPVSGDAARGYVRAWKEIGFLS